MFCTLPFGWKARAFIYHNVGLIVSHAACSFGVRLSQYIDDRHVGQLLSPPACSVSPPSAQRAESVAYIVCYILIEAGYFINISKLEYVPSEVIRFWGFLCDSLRHSFFIPPDKKTKFGSWSESILSSFSGQPQDSATFGGKSRFL